MNGNIEQQARKYHEHLPEDIWQILSLHGLSRTVAQAHVLGWDGTSITCPVRDRFGRVRFLEYWWITDDGGIELAPIQATMPVELMGYPFLQHGKGDLIVVQGILEYLVARSMGIDAVASTGNGLSFEDGWLENLESFDRVFVCLKKDPSSRRVASWIVGSLSNAVILDLPDQCQSLSAFFVDHGLTQKDFAKLQRFSWKTKRRHQ